MTDGEREACDGDSSAQAGIEEVDDTGPGRRREREDDVVPRRLVARCEQVHRGDGEEPPPALRRRRERWRRPGLRRGRRRFSGRTPSLIERMAAERGVDIRVDSVPATGPAPTSSFYGKFRGTVSSNDDPQRMGRIQALVPAVWGNAPGPWAMPCVPMAGLSIGVFAVPPVGAGVWVEFEGGDPTLPIWTGGYWGSAAEMPPSSHGGIHLVGASGGSISVTEAGIVIDNGYGARIALVGPVVDVNNGAFSVP